MKRRLLDRKVGQPRSTSWHDGVLITGARPISDAIFPLLAGMPSGMFLGQPQLCGIGESFGGSASPGKGTHFHVASSFGGSASSLNGLVRSGSPDCPRVGGVAVGGVEGLASGPWGNYSSVLSGQSSDVAVESYNKYCHFCQHIKVPPISKFDLTTLPACMHAHSNHASARVPHGKPAWRCDLLWRDSVLPKRCANCPV